MGTLAGGHFADQTKLKACGSFLSLRRVYIGQFTRGKHLGDLNLDKAIGPQEPRPGTTSTSGRRERLPFNPSQTTSPSLLPLPSSSRIPVLSLPLNPPQPISVLIKLPIPSSLHSLLSASVPSGLTLFLYQVMKIHSRVKRLVHMNLRTKHVIQSNCFK